LNFVFIFIKSENLEFFHINGCNSFPIKQIFFKMSKLKENVAT
jgi:hypothetical protein